MRIYDISLPITNHLPVWPGDPQPKIERFSRMEDGANCNVTQLLMSAHLGTHVDAPYHFLRDSDETVERLSLNTLIGRVYVLHLDDQVTVIDEEVLKAAQIPPRTRRLLIKSRNSRYWENSASGFQPDFTALNASGAQHLVDRGIKLVGVDYLSVAPFDSPEQVHRVLLQAGIVIIEGLDLSEVSQGRYSLYCLPLKIVGADGAPARVVLVGV